MSTKSIKKSFFASLVSLVLCFAMLIGTTYAWFTDSASSAGNKIIAGNLDVELWLHNESNSVNIGDSSEPIFGVNSSDPLAQNDAKDTLWEPGKTQTVFLSIKNAGTLDLKYKVALDVYNVTKNLDKFMSYQITPGAKVGDKVEWTAGTNVSAGTNLLATDEIVALKAGQEHFFALSVHMDELATNEQMNGTIEFDIKVLATQLNSEADFYGPNYDKDATYPDVADKTVTESQDTTPISANDVTVDIPAGEEGDFKLEVSKNFVEDNGNGEAELSLDIELTKNGQKAPDGTYTVSVKIADENTPLNIAKVTHKGVEITSSDYSYDATTGCITFTTSNFSPFAITFYDSNVSVNLPEGATDAEKAEATGDKLSALFAKGGVFTLTDNVVVDSPIVIPKGVEVILDLNGKTLSTLDEQITYAIANLGTLTIKDTGKTRAVVARGIYNGYLNEDTIVPTAKLTIENGDFHAQGTNGGAAVFNYGIAVIKSGNFTSVGSYSLNNRSGASMTVENANVTGGISNAGALVIKSGNIATNRGGYTHAIYSSGGTLDIYGGSFSGNGNEVVNANSDVANIYGGTFQKVEKTSYLMAGSNMTIYGGTFLAHESNPAGHPVRPNVTVMGGTFNYKHTNIADGFKVVEAGDVYMVISTDFDYVADGVLVSTDGKTYYVSNAAGWAWVEAQDDAFFADKTVALAADIDFGGATIKPIKFWNCRTVVDGQGYTLSNFVIGHQGSKTPSGLFSGTFDVKNLNVVGATVRGDYAAVISGQMYGNIDNCSVKNSTVNATYWQTGIIAAQYNAGNITNCVVDNCVINGMSAVGAIVGILNETAGVRKIENCTVSNTTINQNGSFGGDYDNYFGVVVGLVNVENTTVYFNHIKLENNTLRGAASDLMFGVAEESNYVYIDDAVASTLALEKAINAGTKAVILAEGDYALRFTNNTNFNLNDMTIKGLGDVNLAISSTEAWYGRVQGSNVTFENIHFTSSVGATGKATYNNCTFDDWTICASSNKEETTFNNCTINGCLNTSTDFSSGDVFVNNCKIAKAEYSGSMTMNFVDCQIDEIIIWNANTNLTNCEVTKLDDSNVTNATVTIK